MLRIGDFSKIGKVSIRMLRHYDQIGLLKPAGIDDQTGYRSYTLDQLPRLNKIIFLKDIGFSLSEVMTMVDEQISIEEMKSMLIKRQKDLENEIAMAELNLKTVMNRLYKIENEGDLPKYDVGIKEADSFAYVSHRTLVPNLEVMGEFCYNMYQKLYQELDLMNVTPTGTEITVYHNDEYTEIDLDMEAGLLVDKSFLNQINAKEGLLSARIMPAEESVAYLVYSGSFTGLENAISELLTWAGKNEWQINGSIREFHLSGPAHPEGGLVGNAIIELQVPVIK